MIKIVNTLILLCLLVATAQAQQVGVNYTEDYRWHGFNVWGRQFVHPGVTTSLRGVDVKAVSHIGDERENLSYWDTFVGYELPLENLKVRADYGYLILPTMDAQEISATIGLPIGIVTPRYTLSQIIPDNADNGQVHTIGLDVLLGDEPNSITAMLSADLTYNNGINPLGQTVIRDFTHVTAGAVIKIPMQGFALCPTLHYQHTFEEVIEPDKNVCWYGLQLEYAF